jgi:hypothetical protein
MVPYTFPKDHATLYAPLEKYFQAEEAKPPHPQVFIPRSFGRWHLEKSSDLLPWGRGYASVYFTEGAFHLPVKRVKPYHRKGFSGPEAPPPIRLSPFGPWHTVCHPPEVELLERYSNSP